VAWSLKIARFFGIDVRVHWTFLLLIAYVVFIYVQQGASLAGVAEGIGLVLAIFACIVMHEYGHALTAKRYGVKTEDIVLLPIGGMARLQRMPEKPMEELLVAIAGPVVNVVIALILTPILFYMNAFEQVGEVFSEVEEVAKIAQEKGREELTEEQKATLQVGPWEIPFLFNLWFVNIFLVAFNAIPAFPMDGGRVLRAFLNFFTDYTSATRVAAGIGQAVAIVFGIIGLFSLNFILILIAAFVFLGAAAEASMAQQRTAMEGLTVDEAMMTKFVTLDESNTIEDAARELLAGDQEDFPVTRGGEVVGVLSRSALLRALAEGASGASVTERVGGDGRTVEEGMSLNEAVQAMRESQTGALPVVSGGRIVGLLTMDNIQELTMLRSAIARATTGQLPREQVQSMLEERESGRSN